MKYELVEKYLKAFQDAGVNGGELSMDAEGVAALKKISNRMVPSVTEIDDSGRGIGYDLFSRLLKDRIVLLQGQVDEAMAAVACASLLFLDSIGADGKSGGEPAPITVYIDSPGGSVLAGLAMYDTMRLIKSPITTVGMGMQASMGSIMLASGDKRVMTKSSKLMIHQLSGGTRGQATDMQLGAAFSEQLHEDLKSIYVRHIGLKHEFWDLALERDTWLTAEQALKMGFIHAIAENASKKTAYEDEAVRSTERKGLAGEMNRVANAHIEKMSAAEIVAALNNVSSDGSAYAGQRGALVTRLSQFPEFWTEAKKKEMAAAVSNDNKASGIVTESTGPATTPKPDGGPARKPQL